MARTLIPVQQTLALLAETPTRIAAQIAGMSSEQLHTRPEPNEWSANEILAHLRSCSDVWGSCIKVILAQETPTLKAINPTTWINQTDYPKQEFGLSLDAFTTQRAVLLTILEPLSPEEWARSVLVTGAGKPLERNVLFYAQWLARHERSHFKQIEKTVKTVHLSR